jgi:prepilin-type N-terminal cleavage/methylation domain-containing protein
VNSGEIRGSGKRSAFTLIELLVAMAILVIIVLIVGMVFQRASVAWETGMRRADMNMTGRALADFMAQEMSQAVLGGSNDIFSISGSRAEFVVIGSAESASRRAARKIVYALDGGGKKISRTTSLPDGSSSESADMCDDENGVKLEFVEGPGPVTELPRYVDIKVTVSDGGVVPLETVFQSRAAFPNKNRYRQ